MCPKGRVHLVLEIKNGKKVFVLIVKASHMRLRNFEFILWERDKHCFEWSKETT